MKLRRAMVTAAATAVVAPLALLSAPSAFATDGTPSSGTSASQDSSSTSSQTEDAQTEDAQSSGTEQQQSSEDESTGTPGSGTPPQGEEAQNTGSQNTGSQTEGSQTTGSESNTSGTENTTGTEDEKDEKDEKDEADTADPPAGDNTSTAPEGDELPYCEEVDEEYEEGALDSEISDLPGKIVAGSGWHTFSLKVTNTSKATLKEVAVYAEVENFEVDDPSKYLSPYVELEFLNPETKQWEEIRDSYEDEDGNTQEWAGGYFWGVESMQPQEYIKAQLRLNVHKDAPVGDGYSFGTGAYIDLVNGQECIAESYGTDAYFTVLAPGVENEDPGEAKPGDGSKKPAPETKPQGGVSQLPVTGSLAETGSNSALPLIGTVGGVAILAGAGVVFAVRRRKPSSNA